MKALIVEYSKMNGFGGGIYFARSVINWTAAVADEVTLLYPSDDGRSDPELNPSVRLIPVKDSSSNRLRRLLRMVRTGHLHRFDIPFRALLSRQKFDLIVFHNSKGSRGLLDAARKSGARIVTIHDNYEYDYTKDSLPWYLRPLLLPATVRSEREALLGSDLNLALSQADARVFREVYRLPEKCRVEVVGVSEYRHREFPALPDVDKPVFIMTGNLSARQTYESLIPWLREYAPILYERVPDAKLIVAGKHLSETLKHILEEKGIEVVDTPPDMDAVLRRARYYLCPVSKGSGVKLRVMDGLRNGLPVLVHARSARGYELFIGDSVFPYENQDSFVAALDRMLRTTVQKSEMVDRFRSSFSFESGTERFRNLVTPLFSK